jgi:hypothetical protein
MKCRVIVSPDSANSGIATSREMLPLGDCV